MALFSVCVWVIAFPNWLVYINELVGNQTSFPYPPRIPPKWKDPSFLWSWVSEMALTFIALCSPNAWKKKLAISLLFFHQKGSLELFKYYSTHTLSPCFSAAMDSFHQAWASSWDMAFCRGYEGLTVSLTIYQRKDWRFDCWRDQGGWTGVPQRGIETFMTWTRRVFIACCFVIVFWIHLDWAVPRGPRISPGWTAGSREHSGRWG